MLSLSLHVSYLSHSLLSLFSHFLRASSGFVTVYSFGYVIKCKLIHIKFLVQETL
jgi:hypothetical protein